MMSKENVVKYNKEISDSVLVSQMTDHEGFQVFMDWINETEQAIRYQDILGVHDKKILHTQQGIALMLDDLKQYFKQRKAMALKKMIDPDTGVEEVLNKRDE